MRSNLLRAISHDLRTPLTGMIGASSTYLEAKDQLDEDAKDQLVMGIKEDANWLLNMVENLLSITRIQSNGSDTQPHVKKVPEPLEEVVAEAIQRYQKRYPDSELKVKIPEDFLMVPMDPTLIEQVIMNLLENAWVHSGSDAPIEFDIKEEGNKVVFYIRDHGNGIAPERLDQLFDGCAGALDHESRKGMGIGLSICKSIVMAHQGDVYARNYEDGAEFSFSLPMDEKELTEEKEL
jgi:two-component system sensor histidine kinase KdpD